MKAAIVRYGQEPLFGHQIILEKFSASHAEYIWQCYQDDAFMDQYWLAQDRRISIEQIREKIQQEQHLHPASTRHIDWIIKKSDGSQICYIGLASLTDYHAAHQRAEILVGLQKPENRVGSSALEATLLVLEFAFHQAKLHKLISLVYAYNNKGQQSTLHLGFTREACLKEHLFDRRSGQYIDLYQNRLLSKEFFSSKKIGRWSRRLVGRDITLPPPETRACRNKNARQELLNRLLKK